MKQILRIQSWMLLGIFSVSLFTFTGLWSPAAEAHKGHGGSMVKFMKTKAVLKELLPSGAKILKRKERLSDAATDWAEKTFSVDLDDQIHVYFLARDRASGKTLGGAIIMKFSYRHGDVMLGVGVDANQKITGVAIQGISEKYVPDFENTFGKGMLSGYAGKSVSDLVATAESAQGDKPSRFIASKLAEEAAMIAAFVQHAK